MVGSKTVVAFVLADDSSPGDDGQGNAVPVPLYLYVGLKGKSVVRDSLRPRSMSLPL